MPILNPSTRSRLYSLGLNPDEYSDPNEQEQAPEPEQQQPVAKPSPVGSFLRQAGRDILPSAGALASGVQAGEFLTAASAPFVGPFAPLVGGAGGIATGLGVGMLGKYLQNKVIEQTPFADAYKKSEAEDIATNPKSTIAGGLASALPILSPSAAPLKAMGALVRNPGAALTLAEKAALQNSAINAGVQGGVNVGQQLYNTGTVDPSEAALNIVGGGLLSKPTALGRRMGFGETTSARPFTEAEAMGAKADINAQKGVRVDEALGEELKIKQEQGAKDEIARAKAETIAREQSAQKAAEDKIKAVQEKMKADEQAKADEETRVREENYAKQKQAEEQNNQRIEAENKAATEKANEQARIDTEQARAVQEQVKEQERLTAEKKKANQQWVDEQNRQVAEQEASVIRARDFEKANKEKTQQDKLAELTPESMRQVPQENRPLPFDNTVRMEQNVKENAAPQTEAERIQEQYDLGKMQEEGAKTEAKPTKSWINLVKKLGLYRNVKVDDSGRVFDKNGKEIAGTGFVREGLKQVLAKINPFKATLDTLPHELGHPFFGDLKNFGSAGAKKMIERGTDVISKTEPFKEWKNSLDPESSYHKLPLDQQVEEFWMQKGGEDFVRRVLRTDKSGDFKNWLKDFWSNVKHQVGKADESDYARLFSSKLVHDAPFAETSVGAKVKAPVAGEEKKQEGKMQEGTKVPADMMQFGRPSSRLYEYTDWLEKVKGLSRDQALDETIKLREASRDHNVGESTGRISAIDRSIENPGERLQEEGKHYSLPAADKEVTTGYFKPEMDKVGDKSPILKAAMTDALEKMTENRGALNNRFLNNAKAHANLDGSFLKSILTNPKETWKQNNAALENANEYLQARKYGEALPHLSDQEQRIVDEILRANNQVVDEAQKRGIGSEVDHTDNIPNAIDTTVIKELQQNPDGPKGQQLRDDFINFQMDYEGVTQVEAEKRLSELLSGYSNKDVNIGAQYLPLDKGEPYGVPKSWRNKNLLDLMNRHLDRAARRFAYHDAIQSKPEVMAELDKFKENKSVQAVHNDLIGHRYYDDPLLNNLSGIVRATMMGPLTGVRDFVSNLTLGAQHHSNPVQAIKNMAKSLGDMKQNIADGFESGRIRQHMNAIELNGGEEDITHLLKRSRDILNQASGRNWFDQMARAASFGQGKYTTLDFIEQQANGTLGKQGKGWFKNFGEGTNWESGSLTPEELKKISARYVDSVQGNYDARGLAKVFTEGSLSPVLQLARWNAEKTNNYFKYTLTPLRNGNPVPFLMSTLGILGGGELVNYVSQQITGRKKKEPTYAEIGEAKDKLGPIAYKAMGLASAAGHVGMVGDLLKSVLDVTYGKNRPQVYNNVLIEAAENTATTLGNMVTAINRDGFDPEIVTSAMSQVLEDNFQAYRLALGYLSADKKEDVDRANKFRDLRVFNTINGNPVSDLTNPFHVSLEDLKIKEFKRTTNSEEAVKLLPELINNALEKAGNDPEKLKRELSKLKRNSYQSMPSPERMPLTFARYVQFLKNTQGEEVAQKRLTDYLTHQEMNKAKAAAVP